MPTTRGQQVSNFPTAADLKAELMTKVPRGYVNMGIVNAKDMISPWKYDKIPNAKERVKAELLTPENQALINKLKPQASVDETTRLKEQMNALLAETSGGRRKTRKGKSKKTRKTRGRRV